MNARYIVGDVFDGLASLEPGSVDLVLTSPPFLALRSYLPADHPDKAREIGREATPADFLDRLLDVVEACDRVLAPHGSLVFELGDTYSGSGGQEKFKGSALADRKNKVLRADGNRLQQGPGWPLDKSLCGIPTLFAWSLAYGHNLLRPERTTPRWRIRNLVAWCRPNPPVGALGDKVRPATSYLTVACNSRTRYFDLDAVREPGASYDRRPGESNGGHKLDPERDQVASAWHGKKADLPLVTNPAGAPPLDHWWIDQYDDDAWLIPTQPYSGSHYAAWPEKLCVKPILAMCPQRVCRVCGEPSRRIVGKTPEYEAFRVLATENRKAGIMAPSDAWRGMEAGKQTPINSQNPGDMATYETLGWSDCGHDDWRPGVVLDPFAGSGTTLAVATGHGRDAIGVDLDSRNADLALQRVGPMLLTVEHLAENVA